MQTIYLHWSLYPKVWLLRSKRPHWREAEIPPYWPLRGRNERQRVNCFHSRAEGPSYLSELPMTSCAQCFQDCETVSSVRHTVQCIKKSLTQLSVSFFIIIFFIFPSFFFLSTSLCFANRIKTLTKISFSEEKHFYRTETATCPLPLHSSKQEKKIFTKYKFF